MSKQNIDRKKPPKGSIKFSLYHRTKKSKNTNIKTPLF